MLVYIKYKKNTMLVSFDIEFMTSWCEHWVSVPNTFDIKWYQLTLAWYSIDQGTKMYVYNKFSSWSRVTKIHRHCLMQHFVISQHVFCLGMCIVRSNRGNHDPGWWAINGSKVLMKFGGLGTIACADIQNLDILLDMTYISEKVTLGMGTALMGVMNMWRVFKMYTKYEVNIICRNISNLKVWMAILKCCDLDRGLLGSMDRVYNENIDGDQWVYKVSSRYSKRSQRYSNLKTKTCK